MSNEEKLEKEIMQRLTWDDRIDESQIHVSVINKIATLQGCVSTFPEKILAEIETKFIPEIQSVVNEIEIKFPESYRQIEDKEVEDAFFCLLNANSEINSDDIKVSIKKGVVQMHGKVNSYWKKDKIKKIASQVKGVISVSDKIDVIPEENVKDNEIKETLITAMQNSVHIDADKVKLEVINGSVELSGILPSMSMYKAVINLVKSVRGVIEIKDNLKWILRYKTT
jgi:hyperosmotically inducible protein